MKSEKILKIFWPIFLTIVGIFCPMIMWENTAVSIYYSIFNKELATFCIFSIIALLTLLLGMFLKYKKEILGFVFGALSFVSLVLSLSMQNNSEIGPGIILYFGISIVFSLRSYSNFSKEFTMSIRDIVEIGLFVALAFVLDMSFLKIRIGQNGGSISLVMIPLFILCLRKGFVKGFISCGFIYGIMNCILDGYGFFSYPFDYLLAFGSLAIIGIFRKAIINKQHRLKIKGVIFLISSILISIIFRTFFHTLSGMIFYGMDFIGSLIYQLSYLGPSSFAVIIGMIILYKPILMIEKFSPTC